jgi:hypothetical protein
MVICDISTPCIVTPGDVMDMTMNLCERSISIWSCQGYGSTWPVTFMSVVGVVAGVCGAAAAEGLWFKVE